MIATVIGGSGFIGTRLVRWLSGRDSVELAIIDKVPSKAFPAISKVADVRSVEELRSAIAEEATLVNLAAEHRDDVRPRRLYDDVNVSGARNICAVAEEKRVSKIIFTSTVAVYGFAPIGTDENGRIAPFNDYGRTKYEAETVFREWQARRPTERSLVILRPTVVFGENNRGNVYNLLNQIATGRFMMIGTGENRKSMAYVDNVVAFIEHSLGFGPGIHIYNFVDKPDLTMTALVGLINRTLGRREKPRVRVPFALGYVAGMSFDLVAKVIGKQFPISAIRVRKFCSDTVFGTSVAKTGFVSPVNLEDALVRTVRYEFLESHEGREVFYTE